MIKLIRKIGNKLLFFVSPNLRSHAGFELLSFIGRAMTPKLKLKPGQQHYINLGSGAIKYDGFINIDFFWGWGVDYGADLRYPLKISDNSVDGIFCEHTMEHLTYTQDNHILKECYRIMKKGSTIRIIVPDVALFAKAYAENDVKWFEDYERLTLTESGNRDREKLNFPTHMSAISYITQENLHVSCWDYETMKYYLEKNGFREVTLSSFRNSRDQKLAIDLDSADRKHISLYVEAVK